MRSPTKSPLSLTGLDRRALQAELEAHASGELTTYAPALRSCVDVLVVGGGSAALCAAIAARQCGASVHVIEAAPSILRGENARHARNFRIAHQQPTTFVPGKYGEEAFIGDILHVTRGTADRELTEILVRESAETTDWLVENGIHLERRDHRCQNVSNRTAFLLGGGKAMMNALYAAAIRLGATVWHGSPVIELDLSQTEYCVSFVSRGGVVRHVASKTIAICAGGNPANIEWLREELGDAANGLVIRGTPYALGDLLVRLLACGMRSIGEPSHCHMVPFDARGPKFDGGVVTRVTAIPHGIVVDRNGLRIADEGEDIGKMHFSKWGVRISRCPDQIAYLILDLDGYMKTAPSVFRPIQADDVGDLPTSCNSILQFSTVPSIASTQPSSHRPTRSQWSEPPSDCCHRSRVARTH